MSRSIARRRRGAARRRRAGPLGRSHPADAGAGGVRARSASTRPRRGGAARARSTTRMPPRSRAVGGRAGASCSAGCWPAAGRGASRRSRRSTALDLPARARGRARRGSARCVDGLARGGARAQGHRRSGRESRLRIPHRRSASRSSRAQRAAASSAAAAAIAPAIGGGRAGDRLHPLHRHDAARRCRSPRRRRGSMCPPAPMPALAARCAARAGSRWRRSAARRDAAAEARRLGCGHRLEGEQDHRARLTASGSGRRWFGHGAMSR